MSTQYFATISAILIVLGIFIFKNSKTSRFGAYLFSLMTLTSFLLLVLHGTIDRFTGEGINEAAYFHIKYGIRGAGVLEYWPLIVFGLSSITLFGVLLMRYSKKAITSNQRAGHHKIILPLALVFFSLTCNPTVISLFQLWQEKSTLIDRAEETNWARFEEHYRIPFAGPSGHNQKNLVMIYAESLERTFFDEDLFPGLVDGLRELEKRSVYFTNIRQVSGTGWTIAGITASQCGIPLFSPADGNSMSGMDEFLSSATCLGDLLKSNGYHLTFMGGADPQFAGKMKFLKTHGFSEVIGRDDLLSQIQDPSYRTHWGLFDDSLLDAAYEKFLRLSEKDGYFGLFMLTLDTHSNGNPSRSCEETQYGSSILNAVACTDNLVTELVEKITASPFANETLVVITSDHLAMKSSAQSLLRRGHRSNLFMIIDPGITASIPIDTMGSSLDIGPTIMPFLGFDGEIGLGRNLLNSENAESERETISTNLESWREEILAFWNFPRIKRSLAINSQDRTAVIDGRTFRVPMLILLNESLDTVLKFDFDRSPGQDTLVQQSERVRDDEYFILIDECAHLHHSRGFEDASGLCLVAGRGDEIRRVQQLEGNIVWSIEEIESNLRIPKRFVTERVAHAGGGLDGRTYTNSIEALTANQEKGFRYFELDFVFTSDGELVCLHDWDDNFEATFGFSIESGLSLEEFEDLVDVQPRFRNCTLESLRVWMEDNPDAIIVTDVKEQNVRALRMFLESLPDATKRVIPQVYYPYELNVAGDLGFEQIVWTLYLFKGNNDDVLRWIDEFDGAVAVTMRKERAKSGLSRSLQDRGIATYVHTINDVEEAEELVDDWGVTEIYTDFLPPPAIPRFVE